MKMKIMMVLLMVMTFCIGAANAKTTLTKNEGVLLKAVADYISNIRNIDDVDIACEEMSLTLHDIGFNINKFFDVKTAKDINAITDASTRRVLFSITDSIMTATIYSSGTDNSTPQCAEYMNLYRMLLR